MVDTLATDRSDQPFGKAAGAVGLPPDTHGAQSACDDGAVDPTPIANAVLRRFASVDMDQCGLVSVRIDLIF